MSSRLCTRIASAQTHRHTHTRAHTHTYAHKHTHTPTASHTNTHSQTCAHAHMPAHLHTYIMPYRSKHFIKVWRSCVFGISNAFRKYLSTIFALT